MTYHGFNPDRLRLKWRCPHFAHDGSDSAYGRTVYTYPARNYRLFSPLQRGSPLWQLHADRRSCAERSVKRKKLDFGLDHTCIAGRERWFFRVTALRAWPPCANGR